MQKRIFITLIILAVTLIGPGCVFNEKDKVITKKNSLNWLSDDKVPVRGGSLRLFSTFPDTLNPLFSENIYIKDYSALMYDSMYTISSNQDAKPNIVENSQVSPDGLVWTFKLSDNISWHDGIPFSSEDIEYTFNTILGQGSNSIYKDNLRYIVAFSAIDKLNFRVVLQRMDSFLPWRLTFPILAKHYYVGDTNFETDKTKPPIGTGPFKFVEFKANEYIKLKANDKWWGVKKNENVRTPYIEEIEIKLAKDVNITTELFSNSSLDVILLKRGLWGNYVGRRDIILQKYPSNEFEFLAYNATGNSWIEDKNVRKAINLCLDRVEMINAVAPGEATPADIPLFPEALFNDGAITSFSANRDKAKEIFSSKGWKYDGNGKLFKDVNGFPSFLRVSLAVNKDNEIRLNLAKEIRNQLEASGLTIDIKEYSNDEYSDILSKKAFELAIAGIRLSGYPDLSSLYTNENPAVNFVGYNNFELSNLIADFGTEIDYTKKKVILKNIRAILDNEVPYMGLYFYNNVVVYNKKYTGNFEPHSWNKLNDVTSWFLNN